MQRLIQAIDKATRAGVYTLEETANILQAIDQVGGVVKQYKEKQEADKIAAQQKIEDAVKPKPVIKK
tara:strand:- start:16146 stop:16346 length:201 start_codon:yes stop_codon:yes gene_type:complete